MNWLYLQCVIVHLKGGCYRAMASVDNHEQVLFRYMSTGDRADSLTVIAGLLAPDETKDAEQPCNR